MATGLQLDSEEFGVITLSVLLGGAGLTLCILYLSSLSLGIGLGLFCFFVCLVIGVAIVAHWREQFARYRRAVAEREAYRASPEGRAAAIADRTAAVTLHADHRKRLFEKTPISFIDVEQKFEHIKNIRWKIIFAPNARALAADWTRFSFLCSEVKDALFRLRIDEQTIGISNPISAKLDATPLPELSRFIAPTSWQECQARYIELCQAYELLDPYIYELMRGLRRLQGLPLNEYEVPPYQNEQTLSIGPFKGTWSDLRTLAIGVRGISVDTPLAQVQYVLKIYAKLKRTAESCLPTIYKDRSLPDLNTSLALDGDLITLFEKARTELEHARWIALDIICGKESADYNNEPYYLALASPR